jgi:putative alpha-1,2-mannosidase
MSAWFIFSSLGFFPVAGQPIYLLGSPLFSEATLHLAAGKKFVVQAVNNGSQNLYIAGATLNGKPLQRAWLTHQEIVAGGTLRLEMSATPTRWGSTVLPFSLSAIDHP